MNSTTQKLKVRIFIDYKRHPFLKFSEHNELLVMALGAESMLCGKEGNPENLEIEEIIFAVEKK